VPFAGIAHLAESRFGFSASTFLPMALQTPKHLGFGVFMPFGLKMPASWRNDIFDYQTFRPQIFGQRIFYFSVIVVFGSLSRNLNFLNFLGE
jgi:hypothetical protein